MTTATYYVEVNQYWENSPSYFVGPFPSRAAAIAWHHPDDDWAWTPADNVWMSTSTCGGDIRSAWRIYPTPLSATVARRLGLCAQNTLPVTTRLTAAALDEAVLANEL